MDASIEVVGITGGEVPSYDDYETQDSGLKLHCRIAVSQEYRKRLHFDIVRVALQGVLHSTVGSKSSVEDLLALEVTRQHSDFQPSSSSKSSEHSRSHLEITFHLPRSSAKTRARDSIIVPSLNLKGFTTVTRSSALSDLHQMQGQCAVLHWLEAEFQSQGAVVRKLYCLVDLSTLIKPSHMTVLASGGQQATQKLIKVKRKRWWSLRPTSRLFSSMSLGVPHMLGVIASAHKTSGHQLLLVPLTVSMPDNGALGPFLEGGIRDVLVEARWCTTKSFGTSRLPSNIFRSSNGFSGPVIRKGTVIRQEVLVDFPPFLESETPSKLVYSSRTWLRLLLPETVIESSLSTNLASVSYELQLFASFRARSETGASVTCKSTLRIPLQVQMT